LLGDFRGGVKGAEMLGFIVGIEANCVNWRGCMKSNLLLRRQISHPALLPEKSGTYGMVEMTGKGDYLVRKVAL
jgi:hypothetical protein